MARIRTFKPEFFTDEKLVECSFAARLLFLGLISHCDDAGRMNYSAKRIKMSVFPDDKVDIEKLLGELSAQGMVRMYETQGRNFLCIPNFLLHQKIHKPTPSKIPAPFQKIMEDSRKLSAEVELEREVELEVEKESKNPESPHLEIEAVEPPSNSDELIEKVLRLHPANWHWKNSRAKNLQLPFSQCDAVIGAIARDGIDAVLKGTKLYAEHIRGSPGYVMKPERFYGLEAHYLKTEWGKGKPDEISTESIVERAMAGSAG